MVCLVCTACPSDFVLDKDAATRFVFFHTHVFFCYTSRFVQNPTEICPKPDWMSSYPGDSFVGHDSSTRNVKRELSKKKHYYY